MCCPRAARRDGLRDCRQNSFLRSGSVIEFFEQALRDISASVACIADREGLTAHKRSVTIRMEPLKM